MVPSQHTPMQSMGSMEMFPLNSSNTLLIQIMIPKPNTQQTLIITSNIQGDPLINPPKIVVDDIRDITLKQCVGPHMVINTSINQVMHPNPSSPTLIRLENSKEGDSNSNHAPINEYLQHLRPLVAKIDVGSKLVVVAVSMNCLQPFIENSSTHRIT